MSSFFWLSVFRIPDNGVTLQLLPESGHLCAKQPPFSDTFIFRWGLLLLLGVTWLFVFGFRRFWSSWRFRETLGTFPRL